MNQIATITSKMQLTMPVAVAKKIGLKPGQKVLVSDRNGQAVVTPIAMVIEQLAGSLTLPKKWEGKSIAEIIAEAKREHFQEQR